MMEIERLRQWFLKNKRELPWRESPTPYQVWISEVMLQQTQVSVVTQYYLRWMELFPTIEALAKAPLEKVIKAWEGLGYYSRARRLHAAAQMMLEQHQGELPDDEQSLLKITGLGPYTSSAVLSFAYHQKKAAVDGNVLRVMTRYKGIAEDISKVKVVNSLREMVEGILPDEEPWVIMEALIELGALVCKKKPACGQCPLRLSCKGYEEGKVELYPVKKRQEQVIKLYRTVLILESKDEVLLHQETEERKIMAHLWEFPYCSFEREESFPEFFLPYFKKTPELQRSLPQVVHRFTKYQAYLYPSLWKAEEKPFIPGYEWIKKNKLHEYPFSSGHRKILQEFMSVGPL